MNRRFWIWWDKGDSLGVGFWMFEHYVSLKICSCNYFSVYTERVPWRCRVFRLGRLMLLMIRQEDPKHEGYVLPLSWIAKLFNVTISRSSDQNPRFVVICVPSSSLRSIEK